MRIVAALALCGAMLAGQARADPLTDLQAATDAFKQGDLTTAEVLLSEVIDSGKLDGEKHLLATALTRRCAVRIASGAIDAALGDCERAIDIDPSHSSAHLNLGAIYVSRMQRQEAISEFSLALQHGQLSQNDTAMAYSNRGLAYFLLENSKSASKDFNSALAIDPAYEPALTGRAWNYIALGEIDKALADAEAALLANPASPNPINARGVARLYKGQVDEALADFERYIAIAPEKPSGYYNRAFVMLMKSDWEAAIVDLDRSTDIDSYASDSLYLRGFARQKLGQQDLAQDDIDRAIALDATVEQRLKKTLTDLGLR